MKSTSRHQNSYPAPDLSHSIHDSPVSSIQSSRTSISCAAQSLHSVAIVGAGIAGLSAALSLVQTAGVPGCNIVIFEPRLGLDSGQGAGLNLNSGAAILSREYGIDLVNTGGGIHMKRAYSTLSSANFNHSIESLSPSRSKAEPALFDIDLPSTFADTYLEGTEVITMLRENLQQSLNENVISLGVKILRGEQYKVAGVSEERRLVFMDGTKSSQVFDLIIGADGVRSHVRQYIANCKKNRRHGSKSRYTGVKVAWLVTRRDSRSGQHIPKGEMRQMVCDGGTIASYAVTEQLDMIAFLYRDRDRTLGRDGLSSENVNYGTVDQDIKDSNVINQNSDHNTESSGGANSEIKERVRRERIVQIMRKAKVPAHIWKTFRSPGRGSRFIESAVFDHGVLPSWHHNGVVIIGDAAHAMAPFLGQGANQTIQDAHVLALKIREHEFLDKALSAYERTFKRDVKMIAKKSRAIGFLLTQGGLSGYMLRKMLWILTKSTGIMEKEIIHAFQPRFL